MRIFALLTKPTFKTSILFCLLSYFGFAQQIQVEVLGGSVVTQGSTITIDAGSSLDFRITNIEPGSCQNSKRLRILDVDISNTIDFDINPNNPKRNIKMISCGGSKNKNLDFEVINTSSSCAAVSTLVTIEIRNLPDFTFTLEVNSSPEIYVLGGSPWFDIYHGDTTTSDANGTYFGVVEEGSSVTRSYIVANIGSCQLDITAVSSSNSDFYAYSPYGLLPPTIILQSFYYTIIEVTFTAPVAGTGTQTSTISISNSDNTTFTFDVSAEMFNYSIPGPGGITADFRLWLKSTRGIVNSGSTLTEWLDVGTNAKNATTVSGYEPSYIDSVTENINFNPVVKFENDGASIEQYMFNNDSPLSGFYNQDIFIVMVPDATMTNTSNRNTIFAGIDSGNTGDITGIGFGNYSSEFTNETLSYNQDVPGSGNYNGDAEINSSYSNVGIINVRNNAAASPTGQEILYNSNLLTTSNVSNSFSTISASEYWLGRNFDIQGSLNGRIAEIFTFGSLVDAAGRQKIESYLAIKYGITLGAASEAQKNYINSFDTAVWDVSANSGFNYDVAGIGRDDNSDLNQKQSKTVNTPNDVTIGLGGIYETNSLNTNEFEDDGDFLVWGNNNGAFSGTTTNTVTIAAGITTSLTKIDRKWKIVETVEGVGADLETVYVGIPETVFSGFSKTSDEEYAFIVADDSAFADGDIIDVIPLSIHVDPSTGIPILDQNGNQIYITWYNFHETKYFTFGKISRLIDKHSINIASGDCMVGEIPMDLNADAFTVSAWIKCNPSANTRTIMAKGNKLQLRLNPSNHVEVTLDDLASAKFTSTTPINDSKWHQISFVYKSGTIFLYIDGVLDHSEQDVVAPSPNYNHLSIGALCDNNSTTINPFLGEIDEIYIWNQALTEDQVKYLMNQEVEKFDVSGTDYITGKTIPYGSTSNEMASIPWSDLEVYYDFNSFYGSTIEGLADNRHFLRLNYLNKTKTILDDQTTPLPYITISDGDWDSPGTWLNGSDIVLPNSAGLDGSVVDWNIVQIGHDVSSGDRDIELLGLIQTSGTLTIADPTVTFPVENNAGQSLTITNYLELDGVIDLVGESQLIQTENSIIDADSGGYIERDQQGTANGFNYNYWTSSVGPVSGNTATRGTGVSSTNQNYTIVDVINNGTDSENYVALNYDASPSGGTIPPPGLARTVSSYWLYKFYGTASDYYSWVSIDETSSLLPGEGFTMKGTSGPVAISDLQNYVFKGLPNNGDITLELDNTSEEVNRLIGNPYPSALDAREFILDNLSVADGGNNLNGTVFNGALYFWDHFGEENTHTLRGYVGGYATKNLTGGAIAISNDSRINNTSDAGNPATGTKIPGDYIPVNQGFFVSTGLDGFNNDNDPATPISTVVGGDIIFKNSQRVYATEDGSTSMFMKLASNKKTKSNSDEVSKNTRPLIKLIYDSPSGYHRQIVIGAIDEASNGFDLGYDAFLADLSEEDMYWVYNNSKLVIQGVNNFNQDQEFPLGVKVKTRGIISIAIDDLVNVDPSQEIYIKDTHTGETFNIKRQPFQTVLDPGSYDDRFYLVFQPSQNALGLSDIELANNCMAFYESQNSNLTIILKSNNEVLSGSIINLMGQKMKSINGFSDRISIPLNLTLGTYIIQLNTINGIINKKIILN
jgi:hypothetical protein